MKKKVVHLAWDVAKMEIPSYHCQIDVVVAWEDDNDNDIDVPQVTIIYLCWAIFIKSVVS